MLAIRISKPYSELKTFFDKLDKVAVRHVWYQHDVPNNIHIHGLVVGCSVSTDTLKNYIKKDVGNMKATEWSFKTANDLGFITYMSKGTLAPVFNKGFPDDEIREYTSKWVDGKKVNPSAKNKGPTMWDLAEQIHRYVNGEVFDVNDLGTIELSEYIDQETIDYRKYVIGAIYVCRRNRKGFDEFMLRKLITTAMSYTRLGREKIVSNMLEKYLGV